MAAGFLLLSACSTFEIKPRSEIPGMDRLAAQKETYPRERFFLQAHRENGEPIRIAAEEIRAAPDPGLDGGVPQRRVLVFLHGVLSDRRAWDYVAGELGQDYDLLLLDLPGCGQSDKPGSDALGPDAYNPTWLADSVLSALDDYVRRQLDEVQLTLIGHSLGGTVILRMLAEPELLEKHPRVHDRIRSAVLLAPVDVSAVGKLDPIFETIATLSDLELFLGRTFGILSRQTSRAVYYGTTDPETMPREEWLRLYDIINNRETLGPAQWMLRNTVRWRDDRRPVWDDNVVHADHYAAIDVPCLILWGKRDETIEVSMGYKLHSHIRDSQLVILPRSKHALPSERPRVVANQIRAFLERNRSSEIGLALAADGPGRDSLVPAEATFQPIVELSIAEIDASDQFKKDGIIAR